MIGMIYQADPNGKNPHEPGAKLDAGKLPIVRGVLKYFPKALLAVAEVSLKGAQKYAWRGWYEVPDGINRYSDALGRHLLAEAYEEFDPEIHTRHAAQVAWNALARLEMIIEEAERSNSSAEQ